MFKKKMRCKIDECNFSCATMEAMQEHKARVHEMEVHSTSHSSDRDEEEVLLIHSDEDEDIDVDGETDSVKLGSGTETSSPIPPTPPPSFTSAVDDNGNFAIGSTPKQPGFSANSSGTSLEDDHSELASYSVVNEPVVMQDYGTV